MFGVVLRRINEDCAICWIKEDADETPKGEGERRTAKFSRAVLKVKGIKKMGRSQASAASASCSGGLGRHFLWAQREVIPLRSPVRWDPSEGVLVVGEAEKNKE